MNYNTQCDPNEVEESKRIKCRWCGKWFLVGTDSIGPVTVDMIADLHHGWNHYLRGICQGNSKDTLVHITALIEHWYPEAK